MACKIARNETMKSLKSTVNSLQIKVNDMEKTIASLRNNSTTNSATTSNNANARLGPGTVSAGQRQDNDPLMHTHAAPASEPVGSNRTYAQAVASNAASHNPSLLRTIITSTIKTMNRKKSNIIVTGLPDVENGRSDAESFVDLCRQFIGIRPDIARCTRIGKRPQQSGSTSQAKSKPRLLLVTLTSERQVDEIMRQAKLLIE
jgi:hypothetical protein